jgi:hypothetical protein
MKIKIMLFLLFAWLVMITSSCTTGGSFLAQNVTNVELSDPSFKFAARNLEGYSKANYLFGVSYSMGQMANTLALIRLGGSVKLYDDAVQDLWKKYKDKHGEIEGKKLALVNIRYDTDILNLVVYTQTELYITADIVEFVE